MHASVCRYCTWPDRDFDPGKNICKKCIVPTKSLELYYDIQIRKNTNLYNDIVELIVKFIMHSSNTGKKRKITKPIYYDVIDHYGKAYSAKLVRIRCLYPKYNEIGLFKYDGWSAKWDEFVMLDSPRVLKHRKFSIHGTTTRGVNLYNEMNNYNQIKIEVDLAYTKWVKKNKDEESVSMDIV